MEKFEFENRDNNEMFSSFIGRTKDILANLIDNIKENIKGYEAKIEDTSREIEENKSSREKCEREITKMEDKIDTIKAAIENVESTYKRIADAYSSTSKGDTKELYSDIIDGAKASCEKDVEKNRSEIARLNSDIEAIKNNISEFTKVIEELNRSLENSNLELFKYNKALEYIQKTAEKVNEDLDEVSNKKESAKKVDTKPVKKADTKKVEKPSDEEFVESVKSNYVEKPVKEIVVEKETKKDDTEDTLKQLYDLTGYKREEISIEQTKEPEPVIEKKVTDNLESLFTTEKEDKEIAIEDVNPFMDPNFTNWEEIINASTEPIKEEKNDEEQTVDQLLNPYGTTYNRLKSLVGNSIEYKDGRKVPFSITTQDVVNAINAIDGNDLKKMKTVGPEITLLRKVKNMKEGNL